MLSTDVPETGDYVLGMAQLVCCPYYRGYTANYAHTILMRASMCTQAGDHSPSSHPLLIFSSAYMHKNPTEVNRWEHES